MIDSYTTTEKIKTNKGIIEVSCKNVDQWYYSYGPKETTYVVEFEGGFVARVRQGRDKP